MSQQGLLQQSVRDVTGTAYTWEGDWHALFDLDGIAEGPFNGRLLSWINSFLGTSYDNLPGAQAAMALEAGASNWSSIGTIDLSGEEAWTPTDLGASLIAWWSADDLADGAVTTWTDSVGGLAPTQATEANKPIRAATSFNSAYPGVTFDGTNDRLTIAATGSLPTGTNACDLYATADQAALVGVVLTKAVFSYGALVAHQYRALQRVVVSTANRQRFTDGTTTTTDATFDYSGPHITGAQCASAVVTQWFDGKATSPASGAVPFDTVSAITAIGTVLSATNYWTGVIRHIFVTATLSTGDRQKLEGWMAWDSGLAANLDASHPYKAAAP